jgi:hypothetical protein
VTVVLIYVVCLLAAPADCHDVPSGLDVTRQECAIAGQRLGAEWIGEHPGYFLERWKCRIGMPEHAA